MFLKTLEAQGFKSFPDKTTLKFEKGITGVVGPNGSGKSNISDAIRWVLGEQSNKQLRGEKSEDVVFNGTASRRPQGMAQVTLCLDNRDRALNCDSDEVFITRRYYRSGESEYQINHATVRLKDINELFMDTGLGRDGYSMIGQGKISDIVSRKSDDRREMFEEAAGISRFRYRKTEAERKLSAAEENLVRLRDIMQELTLRVGPLEEQCKKAKKFLELSGQCKELEVGLWLISLEKVRQGLKEQTRKIDIATLDYENARDRIDEIIEQLDESGAQTRLLTVQMDGLRRGISECEESAARIEGQIAVCENNIFHNNQNIEQLKGDLSNDSLDSALSLELEQKNKELEKKQQDIKKQRMELSNSAAELETLLTELEQSDKKLDAVRGEIALLTESIAQKNIKSVTASSSLSEIETRKAALKEGLSRRQKLLDEAYEEKAELEKDLERFDEKIKECENSQKGAEMLINSAKEKIARSNERLQKLTLDEGEALRRAKILTDMENSLDGFNNTVKTVVKEAEKGRLSGIKGPVSRLLFTDEKYSVAVEVALGGALQNIVTKTEGDAKKAILFLKQNRLGRATFLPLTNLKERKLTAPGIDSCAGYLGTADSLVSFESEYKPVFSYLLGGIAVAEDIDSAASIAKKFGYKFRVVTLDGQTVNAGGSLTGGSFSRSAGLLSRSGEIEKLKAKAADIRKNIEEEQKTNGRLSAELSSRLAAVEGAAAERTTANEDKIRVVSELRRVSENISLGEKALNELLNEQQQSARRIAELEQSAKDANEAITALKTELEAKQNALSELTGQGDELSAKREKLLMGNSAVRVTILSLENEAEVIKDSIASVTSRQNDAKTAKDATRLRIEQLEAANAEETEKIERLKGEIAELKERAEQSRRKSEQKLKERTELEAGISSLTAEERDLSAKKERLSSEVTRLTERRDNMQKEQEGVVSKLFDKYELTVSAAEELDIKIDDIPAADRKLREIKGRIKSLGNINLEAIDEYAEVSERYEFMKTQLSDVERAKTELERLISELVGNMQTAFNEKFTLINKNFSATFVELFGGGTAHLVLSDPADVLNSGIEIKVQPPGKNVSSIEQLSGGEKSIVALAIYFAMMKVAPPPFCMLDEVESALDDVNVDRFARYLRRMCGDTQFIVVTHRRGTMEEADVLYGVTMQEKGVSKILKLEGKEYNN